MIATSNHVDRLAEPDGRLALEPSARLALDGRTELAEGLLQRRDGVGHGLGGGLHLGVDKSDGHGRLLSLGSFGR